MSFKPTYPIDLAPLPPQKAIDYSAFSDLLLKARVELAELKGASGQIPNPLLLTSPLLIKESVESSGIENINTTVANVLENQLLPDDEQSKPNKEVLKYRQALFWGMQRMQEVGLNNRLILGIHEQLMLSGGGVYRREQNQIVNSTTGEVLYTPPLQNRIQELIGNWENYINDESPIDPLIRSAIAHQQFESIIHPFMDGNGRTGRILMVLGLVKDGVLDLPIIFISGYINKNRTEYYRLLRAVTIDGAWEEYITFMLLGFYLQAKETKETLNAIVKLHNELRQNIKTNHPKIYSADLLEVLFSYPVITPTKLAGEINVHYTTGSKYLLQLAEAGILESMKVGRNHFFVNQALLKVLN